MSQQPGSSSTFSLLRVLALVLPIAVAAYAGANWYKGDVQRSANDELNKDTLKLMLDPQGSSLRLAEEFSDADGDLLADAPAAADKLLEPAELVFSYVASPAAEETGDAPWKELVAALGKALGKPVKYQGFADPEEQLRALKGGKLHITAFGTGEVPAAVNTAGFIPAFVPGDAEGKVGYTMKIIVPADSELKSPEDIRGHRMTFTRPNSNSGYKAALVLLLDEFQLAPERDYAWGFSYGHEQSIQGIVKKSLEAASVASDILDRRVAAGEASADAFKTIYESERFPPGAFGYAYNLAPELKKKIDEVFADFEFAGTGLEKEFSASGAVKFVPVDYKDDWGNVRRIDAAAAKARDELVGK